MPHIAGHGYGDLSTSQRLTEYQDSFDFTSALSGIDEKYLEFAPTYDSWKEKYIGGEYDLQGQEYGLAGELYGMAQERSIFEKGERDRGRESASDTLAFSLRGMGQQMGSTLASAQDSTYDIFSQGEQVASGGLGTRSNLTKKSMKSVEDTTERSLMSQAMTGIGAKSAYEDTLASISGQAFSSAQALEQSGISYEAAGISYDRAGMQRDKQMEGLVKDYEDEMYDYLLMLGQNFDVWGGSGGSGGSGSGGGLDPIYDPDGNPEGQNLGGFNNTGMSYEELLALYAGGNKTGTTTGGGGGTTIPRTGP
jgi:hypothetical protein